MAKINKYWGFVAVGALTAAAAGAIAAAFLKRHTDPEDFEFDDDDFDQADSEEEPVKESKEVFQSWEPSPNGEAEDTAEAASQENAGDEPEDTASCEDAGDKTEVEEASQEEKEVKETTTEIPVE